MPKAKKKAAPKKGSEQDKPALKGRPSSRKTIIMTVEIEVTNGKEKITKMEVIKTEKYKTKGRKFEIYTQRNDKKHRLVIDVFEIRDGQQFFIHELRGELKIEESDLKAGQYKGYDKAIAAVKESISMYRSS